MKIENIETYEGPYLYTCYWMVFISILRKMEVDENYIILNIIPTLKKDDQNRITYVSQPIVPIDKVFKECDIIYEEYFGEDLYSFLKESIDAQNPVVVSVDCFYIDYIQGYYGKTHMSHCLLVYGYEEKNLKIIDHSYDTGLKYICRDMSYDMLHESYVKNQVGIKCAISFAREYKNRDICVDTSSRIKNIKDYFKRVSWFTQLKEIIYYVQNNIHAIDEKTVSEVYQFGMGLSSFQHIVKPFLSNKCSEQLDEFCNRYLVLRTCYYKLCHTSRYRTNDYYDKTKQICEKCCEAGERWYKTFMEEI